MNKATWHILSNQGKSIDAIVAGAVYVEDKISCYVGLAGNPDRDDIVTLDACIMYELANCGAVASMERIKNTLSVEKNSKNNTASLVSRR